MIQINLLPWREQKKIAQKNHFILLFAIVSSLTIFTLIVLHFYLRSITNEQQENNNFLQAEITKEEKVIVLLKAKKKEQENLNAEIKFIFSLRDKDYKAVRFLDELVKIIPENVYLTKITKEGNDITLYGTATNNLQVTLFMRNMAKSAIFDQPVLTEMSDNVTDKENETVVTEKRFQLKVKQKG